MCSFYRLPNKIYGFLDLTKADLPPNHGIKHAGSDIEAAVYAVVENALYVNGGETTSEIFVPVAKEVGGLTNNRVSHLRFYLADAEAFVEPVSVVPDIGGPPNNCFMKTHFGRKMTQGTRHLHVLVQWHCLVFA